MHCQGAGEIRKEIGTLIFSRQIMNLSIPKNSSQNPNKGVLTIASEVKGGHSFEAPATLSNFNHSLQIKYVEPQGERTAEKGGSEQPKFDGYRPDTISFTITIDNVFTNEEEPSSEQKKFVSNKINDFKKTTYVTNNELHEPAMVLITYGSITIPNCRLESCKITYSHFDVQGEALKAQLDVSFITMPATDASKFRSPDMSRIRIVKESDTLFGLCQEAYGDSSLYLAVARANGLVNFRHLTPGMELIFPPLKK